MSFHLTILGTGSANPVVTRNATSHFLMVEQEGYLFDCGEATQTQLLRFKLKATRIKYIFITHLHGDHFFGLIGLLSTLNMHHRVDDLYIYGPKGLAEVLTLQMKYSDTRLNFKVHFEETRAEESYLLMENDHVKVTTIPLVHRVACCGFLIEEKEKPHKILKELLPANISIEQIKLLKEGQDVLDDNGEVLYSCDYYTIKGTEPDSYAFCTDTAYHPPILPIIKGVKLLYHETTFLHELEERAKETCHSTAYQAGQIAKEANVKNLLIGHFSSRYKDLTPFIDEARQVFDKTILGEDGMTIDFRDLT